MGDRLTVLDVVQKSADFLERKSVESPRLNAEWLAAHALNLGRMELYMQFDRPLQPAELDLMRDLVSRRGRREPLQYIIGEAQFHDLMIKCDRRALIPRPETEQLIDYVVDLGPEIDESFSILDLGTGTGAIALTLAMRFPCSKVVATDASQEALDLATENALGNGLQNRIELIRSLWFEALEGKGPFRLIVSNPPYLTESELESAEPEVRDFEPRSALVAENEGMEDALVIIRESIDYLEPAGSLWLETGICQHSQLLEACSQAGYQSFEGIADWADRPRFIHAVK